MKKSLFAVCFYTFTSLCIFAQTSVSHYVPQKDILDGVAYSLPMSKVNIAVTAECTICKVGPFFQYAKRYLATNDIILEESRKWEISDVQFQPVAVPDPSKSFQVAFDKKGISNNISFYDKYLIAAVNSVYDSVMAPACLNIINDDPVDVKFNADLLSEDALLATSIPKMAEMVARQIYRIRESRTALLAADVEKMPDGKALRLMLNKLNKEEKELVSLFVGKSVSFKVTKVFSITPDSDISDYVIARISSAEGLVDAMDVIGTPIYLNVKGTHLSAPASNRKREKGVKGFFFNVPGEAVVSVSHDDFSSQITVPMPQFGYVNFLNPELTNFPTAKIVFNPLLGTITSLSK